MEAGSVAPALGIPSPAGRVVLVNGSSTGIGAAVACGFANQGARVALHANAGPDAAEATVPEIRPNGEWLS